MQEKKHLRTSSCRKSRLKRIILGPARLRADLSVDVRLTQPCRLFHQFLKRVHQRSHSQRVVCTKYLYPPASFLASIKQTTFTIRRLTRSRDQAGFQTSKHIRGLHMGKVSERLKSYLAYSKNDRMRLLSVSSLKFIFVRHRLDLNRADIY